MIQRRLAASILDCSPERVWFDPSAIDQIREAITKADVRQLIKQGIISRNPIKGISNIRLKQRLKQKAKGRRTGAGSRRGLASARTPTKEAWVGRVRIQRALLFRLREREKIAPETFKLLYRRVKGGFFRSERHIKMYCEEQNLFTK